MRDYHIKVFWSQEDDAYIADIPDLKYCSAHGPTPEAALREVLTAKDAWLETAKGDGNHRRSAAGNPGPGGGHKVRLAVHIRPDDKGRHRINQCLVLHGNFSHISPLQYNTAILKL